MNIVKSAKSLFSILSVCLLVLVILFVVLNIFFIECRQVYSGSMANTLLHGDYVLSWRLNLANSDPAHLTQLHYKDIIIFDLPKMHESLIKRIIGMPGDTVALTPAGIYVNGKYLQETYLKQAKVYTTTSVFQVPKDQLFVLGDNRPTSEDSEEFGPIPLTSVKGKVFFIYYPFFRFRWLP